MINRCVITILLLVLAASRESLSAQTINIDFGTGPVYDDIGQLGTAVDTLWNAVSPWGATDLLYADGSGASGVSIATTLNAGFVNNLQVNSLLTDFAYPTSGALQATITISGLAPNSCFDIAFYNGFYWEDYTIPSQPGLLAETRPDYLLGSTPSPPFPPGSVAILEGVISSWAGEITILDTAVTTGGWWLNRWAIVAGMQISAAPPADTDGDGLTDDDEINIYGTNPNLADTDNDLLNDFDEVNVHCTDPIVADSDGDSLSDGDEVGALPATNPCDPDTDGDGAWDGIDPTPVDPGVTSGFIEDQIRNLADYICGLNLSLFTGPNNNAKLGRCKALGNRARAAAKHVAHGNYSSAINVLANMGTKVDGDPVAPDWLNATAVTEQEDILNGDLTLSLVGIYGLISLLQSMTP